VNAMPEIRTMKIIVSAMTLLLVVLFIGVLYGLVNPPKRQVPSAVSASSTSAAPVAWEKALPAGAQPLSASAADGLLTVLADTPNGRTVFVFELKSGEMRATLTPAP